eukprot:2023109-Pleurochrysis_carterae.AAC.1
MRRLVQEPRRSEQRWGGEFKKCCSREEVCVDEGRGDGPWQVQKRGRECRAERVESESCVGAGAADRAE